MQAGLYCRDPRIRWIGLTSVRCAGAYPRLKRRTSAPARTGQKPCPHQDVGPSHATRPSDASARIDCFQGFDSAVESTPSGGQHAAHKRPADLRVDFPAAQTPPVQPGWSGEFAAIPICGEHYGTSKPNRRALRPGSLMILSRAPFNSLWSAGADL